MARFLMNVMMASGGYPGTVIRVEDRNGYLTTLENTSIDLDIRNRFFLYGHEIFKSKVINGPEDILFQSKCAKIHSVSFEGRLQKHLE